MRSVSVVVAAGHPLDVLDQLLRAERFVGVQAAVDPDDRLALAWQARGAASSVSPSAFARAALEIVL